MAKRRPICSLLIWLLAALVLSGSAMPSPWLWQCRHASEIVAVPVTSPGAMPCRMAGMSLTKGVMACCAKAPPHAQGTAPQIGPIPCRPLLEQMAASPATLPSPNGLSLYQTSAGEVPSLPPFSQSVRQALTTLVSRQRPPPQDWPASLCRRTPALRAPPVA